uniref:Ig-like domain-containing protein n=1 Tax=Oreochromis aureus TaxID=47969 RepID=A0AAZ1X656_OREAU
MPEHFAHRIIGIKLYFVLTGHSQDVTQQPEIRWSYVNKAAEMNCSHNKDKGHNQMYWYIQRPGETMRLIVYTVFGGKPDYGGAPEKKYSASKAAIENGALTVNDLQQNDTGVYFCAVSKHSDVRSRRSCTKTARQPT